MVATPIVYENYVFASSAYGTGSGLIRVVPDVAGLKAEKIYVLEAMAMQTIMGAWCSLAITSTVATAITTVFRSASRYKRTQPGHQLDGCRLCARPSVFPL